MESEIIHNRTISVDDIDSLVPEQGSTNASLAEDISFNGGVMNKEWTKAGEVLTKVELDIACSSEKLINLSVLMMTVGTMETDFDSFASANELIVDDSAKKAMEVDLLSGIMDSEIDDLRNFIGALDIDIQTARDMISSMQHLEEDFWEMENKLQNAENSLKQLQDQVLEMKTQSAKSQRIFAGIDGVGGWTGDQGASFPQDGDFSKSNPKIKMQTAEQQRHFLRMLERSLARELELEKRLSESKQIEEDLRMKQLSAEQDVFYMEEEVEDSFKRLFEAETASEVLLGMSKELLGKFQVIQFSLNGSFKREKDLQSELLDVKKEFQTKESVLKKLEDSNRREHDFLVAQAETLKARVLEAEDKLTESNLENLSLRDKLRLLEERYKEQDSSTGAQMRESEIVVVELKEKLAIAENRAEAAETRCNFLSETNLKLDEELGLFKHMGFTPEKFELLEKQMKEYDTQLQHAKASIEASQEKENMLYSTICDMENLIDNLKMKVQKADNRAEIAEDKLIIVSESNAELNDELVFLRGRLESLKGSLLQAEEAKVKTAKDIGVRTKLMTNLVMQLAAQRERLHKQISTLSMENSVLVVQLKQIRKGPSVTNHDNEGDGKETLSPIQDRSFGGCIRETSSQVTGVSAASSEPDDKKPKSGLETELVESDSSSEHESVRRLDAGALGFKRVLAAVLMILISGTVYHLLQLENESLS